MPFNFSQYAEQCSRMDKAELLYEIERQGDAVAAAGAGTGFAVLAIPLTMGLSVVALGGTAPAIINARKKKSIAKKYYEKAESTLLTPDESPPAMPRRPVPSRQQPAFDEQLPAYTPGAKAQDTREKQVFVPSENVDMDLPPSYDEAALKRMSTRGLRPRLLPNGQWTLDPADEMATASSSRVNAEASTPENSLTTTGQPQEAASGSEVPRQRRSLDHEHAHEDAHDHTSVPSATYSPSVYSPLSPNPFEAVTPPDNHADVHVRIGDAIEAPQQTPHPIPNNKNPFLPVEENASLRIHTSIFTPNHRSEV